MGQRRILLKIWSTRGERSCNGAARGYAEGAESPVSTLFVIHGERLERTRKIRKKDLLHLSIVPTLYILRALFTLYKFKTRTSSLGLV